MADPWLPPAEWAPLADELRSAAPPGPVVVIGPGGWDPASWPDQTGPSAVCVLDRVIGEVESADSLLDWGYTHLVEDGVLILTVGRGQRFTRPALSRLLFQSGFSQVRFHPRPGGLALTAVRAPGPPPTGRPHRLSVIVPAYNEAETFAKTMELVLAKEIEGVDIEVIVVESNSTDGTREQAQTYGERARVTVVLEDRPRGKGHAVRRGLQSATGDFVLIQDADLEYDVDDYEALLEPLRRYRADFVLGRRVSRHRGWGLRHFGRRDPLSLLMNVGHLLFLGLFDAVYGVRLHDPFTMYKVFRRDCIEGMLLESDRFDFDWELTAKLIRAGYHPVEVPVSYQSRSFSEGKKIRLLRDPLSWVRACVRYRFSRIYGYE